MNLHRFEQLREVTDRATFRQTLIEFAVERDFPLVSGVLRVRASDGAVSAFAIGNCPEAYLSASRDAESMRRDPVIQRLISQPLPVAYDQTLYAQAGAGDLWEQQAPFGYRTGLAVSTQAASQCRWLLGIDREAALPRCATKRARLMADLQLLAIYAAEPAQRLLVVSPAKPARPQLSQRQTEILKLTLQGKSAWVTGALLGISENTVNYHFKQIFKVLGVSSKNQAVLKALELGLI